MPAECDPLASACCNRSMNLRAVALNGRWRRWMMPSGRTKWQPASGTDGYRWRRSVAIGPEPQTLLVPVEELKAVDGAPALVPDRVRGILVVVDTVNTPPGRRGTVSLHELRAEAGAPGAPY